MLSELVSVLWNVFLASLLILMTLCVIDISMSAIQSIFNSWKRRF